MGTTQAFVARLESGRVLPFTRALGTLRQSHPHPPAHQLRTGEVAAAGSAAVMMDGLSGAEAAGGASVHIAEVITSMRSSAPRVLCDVRAGPTLASRPIRDRHSCGVSSYEVRDNDMVTLPSPPFAAAVADLEPHDPQLLCRRSFLIRCC